MNRRHPFFATVSLALVCQAATAAEPAAFAQSKPQVERKDGFFGIHFDLHPNKSDTVLGRDVSEENIRAFLRRVRPDFIQYDCVGVPGYSGYPTKVGWPAPGIVKDSLAVWRKVTREERVALLIHYCVLWNQAAVEHHPDWAVVNANGERDKQVLSIFSPFAEQLLIPQLKEAATLYDLDGAWMDADGWVARLDYSPAALAEWKRQTGRETAPKSRQEANWQEWKMFHRREFEKYLRRYVDAIHAHSPKFQIACNWMYSFFHGVWPVGSEVDYLSGDYPQHNSTDEARRRGPLFRQQPQTVGPVGVGLQQTRIEKPHAIEAGGGGHAHAGRRVGHLLRPHAIRADFGTDHRHRRRGGRLLPRPAKPSVSKAKRCRRWRCWQSAETYWDQADDCGFRVLWPVSREDIKGALFALLELHYSVDILAEHQLLPRLREFPVVVIPDAYKLTDEFRRALLDYVEAGGSLVLLGEKCARLFEPALGVNSTARRIKAAYSAAVERTSPGPTAGRRSRSPARKPSPIAVSQPNRRRPENRRPPWLREAKAASPPSMDRSFRPTPKHRRLRSGT